jgi:hypothetical protein
MPRPIQIRPSYEPSAAFVIRLHEAVGKDTDRHTAAWLLVTQEKLMAAAQQLLTAREDEQKKKAESDRNTRRAK